MDFFTDVASLQATLTGLKRQGKRIGFVPTMGALHEGHLSLVARAREENDYTLCSIYVNPTQFNDASDLKNYPRTLDQDREMLMGAGCDGLFFPTDAIMYPKPTVLRIQFGHLETVMEGMHRPGHFQGVGLVVGKLLHLTQPDRAYFGEKDLQQFAIIRQLVHDLMFPVEVIRVPIVREPDGLAMSSRNRRLSAEDREQATLLYRTLSEAKGQLLEGKSIAEVKNWVATTLAAKEGVALEYFEVAHSDTLELLSELSADIPTSLCIAAQVGPVRLIDNLSVSL